MFELKQYPHQQPRLLQLSDVNIMVIENEAQFAPQNLLNADGVLIQTANSYEAESILHMIRSHKTKELAMMPVFLDVETSFHKQLAFLFDGIFDPGKEQYTIDTVRKINSRVRQIQYSVHELDFDRYSKLRFLQFMYTRECFLKPVLNRKAQLGYTYTFIHSYNSRQNDIYILSLLNQLSNDGFVTSRVHDKVHSCSSCQGGVLNYRECCPKCGSSDLSTSDLIHHFVCANIGPEEDYKHGEELICPKCDKHLRHIGIDYDKPSSMNSCNNCNHEFQNANVKAICVDCGCDNELSQLSDHTIYSYEITEKGEYTALNGFNEAPKSTESTSASSSIISPEIFDLFKRQEIHRVQAGQATSFEINVAITSHVLQFLHDDRKEIVQKEIVHIIANYLNATDLVCSPTVQSYRALICGSNKDHIEQLMELIYTNIYRLLADGIEDKTLEIEISAQNILQES